jgi:hypothetical protein
MGWPFNFGDSALAENYLTRLRTILVFTFGHERQAFKIMMASIQKDDWPARGLSGILTIGMTSIRMTGVCCCPHPTVTAAASGLDGKPAF